MMHVGVFNPNSDLDIARRMARLIQARSAAVRVTEAANDNAPAYITSPEELERVLPAALARLATAGQPPDLLVVACFSDIRQWTGLLPFPALSIADCSIRALGRRGQAFSILTGGHVWQDPIGRHVEALGFGHLLASVRTLPGNAVELLRDGAQGRVLLDRAIDDCIAIDGAHCVLLAGGGFIGTAAGLRDSGKRGVVDCGECTVDWIEELLAHPPSAKSQN